MEHSFKVRRLVPALTDNQVKDLIKKFTLLTISHVDAIVTTTEIGLRPDGSVLDLLLKGVLPYDVCAAAYPVALSAAQSPVIGGSRAQAAGAPMKPRTRKDGSLGNRLEVPYMPHLEGAKNGVLGYYDKPHCRETSYTAKNFSRFAEILPLVHVVDSLFRQHVPERHSAQQHAAQLLDDRFIIGGTTAYTTMTVNRNWQTAVHQDKGDLKSGFGTLCCLSAGEFSGGQLVFPRYRIAIDFRMQDVLLCDVHEAHGNLPIVGVKGEYERVSIVFYFRAAMLKKCSAIRATHKLPTKRKK
jgi:hypothetical protein